MHSAFDDKYHTEIYTVPTNDCEYWREFMDYKEDFYKMIVVMILELA